MKGKAEISKEDVYMLIASRAIKKMGFLFSDEESEELDTDDYDTYIGHGGKEYGKWDVPVFIALNGVARGYDSVRIYHSCLMQMRSHGFSPDPEKLNKIYSTVVQKCSEEAEAILTTDDRFDAGDDPVEIFNDIKTSLQ